MAEDGERSAEDGGRSRAGTSVPAVVYFAGTEAGATADPTTETAESRDSAVAADGGEEGRLRELDVRIGVGVVVDAREAEAE